MPNTPTAKKRLRQNDKRRAANRSRRSALRTQIRKVRAAAMAGDFETVVKELRLANRRLDQAAAANLIHRNTASRLKSRLSSMVKRAQQSSAA